MINSSIGIFDSGLGGLSILREIQKILPHESIIYLADEKNCPYGNKSPKEIRKYTIKAIRWLIKYQHIKLLVIACNTATTVGIEYYRKIYPDIDIIGVVPAVKTAAKLTKNKHIGVFSTKRTSQSPYLNKLIKEFCKDVTVTNVGSVKLAGLIETGILNSKQIQNELVKYCRVFQKNNIDTLVLGCTHYPFIAELIQKNLKSKVKLVDSSEAVVRRVMSVLKEKLLINNGNGKTETYFTTGNKIQISKVASSLLRKTVLFDKIEL
jgi:glutamate racemase